VTDERISRELQLELAVLRAMCADAGRGDWRETFVHALSGHNWKGAEHRIVFEAVASLGGRPAKQLREELPAQATRMGFPDVNWADYFTVGGATALDLETPVRKLMALAAQDAEPGQT
jgi:hypothetical protein